MYGIAHWVKLVAYYMTIQKIQKDVYNVVEKQGLHYDQWSVRPMLTDMEMADRGIRLVM